MKYEILLRAQCYDDLEESFEWYSNREEKLGSDFLKQVGDCFERIKSNPYLYPLIYKNIRRALVKKFPFGVFYHIDKNKIIVFAVFHSSRNPKSLEERF